VENLSKPASRIEHVYQAISSNKWKFIIPYDLYTAYFYKNIVDLSNYRTSTNHILKTKLNLFL